jgi:hypothetical protein
MIETANPRAAKADASPPGEFHIVNPAWHLPHNGQHAELARLSDGRLVARQVFPGQHGKPSILYWAIDEDARANPQALNGYDDELFRLQQALDRANASPNSKLRPAQLQKTPLEVEAERFCREYPNIGFRLGLGEIRVTRSFEVGRDVWHPWHYEREVTGDIDWRAYLDLHGAGDFGLNGKLDDVGPLTQEQAWAIGLQSQSVRNAEAIRAGLGVITSEWRPTGPTGKGYVVRAQTALVRDVRKCFTWLTVATPQR